MKTLLKLVGAIALVAGAQAVILPNAVADTSLRATTVLASQTFATDLLPKPVFSSETYQPPDNGGPTTSQGSGTR
ncbi:hypothetical protein H6G00_09020 [Leptolyngbya sp. FACHB-541]|uniref:hypothetical protein n=1 Tax=Leptolyngbya sp. FACHB-541 TaxID=2692810 RepID=UPI0016897D3A|nr:hypothetical protein [Leptolyngbya sp. FACHB-541]MBD1870400.1 hypothetical protein [Cyanobacteria bacterium FACHB-471]MBD1996758.1 hypothetical protein [Leptolyngbya sp. FACHB-541]